MKEKATNDDINSPLRNFFQYTIGHTVGTIILCLSVLLIPLFEPDEHFSIKNYSFFFGLNALIAFQSSYYQGAWGEYLMKISPHRLPIFITIVAVINSIIFQSLQQFWKFPTPLYYPLMGVVLWGTVN